MSGHKLLFAVGLAGLSLLLPGASAAAPLLDVNFESGYAVGALEGQSGGTTGGAWSAPAAYGDFRVIDAFPQAGTPSLGSHAISTSRTQGGGIAQVTMASGGFDTMAAGGTAYLSVDFLRGDDDDRGGYYLLNTNSGALTGIGIEIAYGASPVLKYINSYSGTTTDTAYVIENGKWNRVEWEIHTGATLADRTFDLFVQKEGVPGRTMLANDVQWDIWNQVVQGFWAYPLGLSESVMLTDNVYFEVGSSFPVDRPLVIPEPASLGAVAASLLAGLRRRQR